MELMEIVAAPNQQHTYKHQRLNEIVTDFLGCCQIAHRRKQHPQLTNNYIALMNPLKHDLKDFKGTIRWTPAFPVKRNSMSAN